MSTKSEKIHELFVYLFAHFLHDLSIGTIEVEVIVGIGAAVLVTAIVSVVGVIVLLVVRWNRTHHRKAESTTQEIKDNPVYAETTVETNPAYGVCTVGDGSIQKDTNSALWVGTAGGVTIKGNVNPAYGKDCTCEVSVGHILYSLLYPQEWVV